MKSTERGIRRALWKKPPLGLGYLGSATFALFMASGACSDPFGNCHETRTCPVTGGNAGSSPESAGGADNASADGGTGSHDAGANGSSGHGEGEAGYGGSTSGGGGAGGSSVGNSGGTAGGAGNGGSAPMSAGTSTSDFSGGAGGSDSESGSCEACSPECPCGAGQGPCQQEEDCETSLVCGKDAGPKFGLNGNACVPAHCTNDKIDGGETTQDCGGGCGCPLFEILSDDPSCANDVSEDGSFVTGYRSRNSKPDAVRWSSRTTLTTLEAFTPNTPGNARGVAISPAGDIIVGYSTPDADSREYHVAMWRLDESWRFVDLGILPSGTSPTGAAHGVSADGSVVVGMSGEGTNGRHQAFRWTQSGGYALLGFVDGGPDPALSYSTANAVTPDGSVIVGKASNKDPAGVTVAFSWTAKAGMVSLGKLEGGSVEGEARSVNRDGSVIVGMIDGPSGWEAFRWAGGKMVGLGDLSGGTFSSSASDVSADGARIVGIGRSESRPDGEAFFWDELGGMRTLKDAMAERGFEDQLSTWTFETANAISGNGKVVVGCARNSTSSLTIQAYRVRLDP